MTGAPIRPAGGANDEHAHAEAALPDSEGRLRSLFETMGEGVAVMKLVRDDANTLVDAEYLEVNPAFERLTGADRARVVGRRASELFPMDFASWQPRLATLKGTAGPERAERYVAEIGRWLSFYAAPFGGPDGFVVFLDDITDRKLRERQQEFLLKLSDVLRPLSEPEEIEREASRILGESLNASWVYYVEYDDPPEHATIHADYRRGDRPSLAGRYRMDSPGMLEELKRGRTMVVEDLLASPLFTETSRAQWSPVGVRSLVTVPIVQAGRLIAALGVADAEPRDWSDAVGMVEETAHRTWAALQRGRAETALRISEVKYSAAFDAMDQGFCIMELVRDASGEIRELVFRETNRAFLHQTGLSNVTGRTVRELLPAFEPYWIETFSRVARTGAAEHVENYARDLDRWYDVFFWRVGHEGSPFVAVLFTDVTARRAADAAIQASEERQTFMLKLSDALRPIADAMTIKLEALRVLRAHLGVPRALFAEALDQDGTMRITAESVDPGLPPMQGLVLRFSDFTPEALAEALSGRPLWREDVLREDHTPERQAEYTALGTRSWAMAPLVTEGRFVAELTVHAAEARAWTAAEIDLIQETAERTWAAVERARAETALHALNETLERRVVERTAERDTLRRSLSEAEEAERRRLARELHDRLGQHLTGFALELAEVRRRVATDQTTEARVARLEELARLMTRDARSLALELRPPELDDVGLESALDTYVREWGVRHGVATDVAVLGVVGAIPPDVGSALYRITQEALTNVARHAAATQVSVILEKRDNEVRLLVEDNGRGFDVNAAARRVRAERRLGMGGMRERAVLVGGILAVESSPGVGTTIQVRVPVREAEREMQVIGDSETETTS